MAQLIGIPALALLTTVSISHAAPRPMKMETLIVRAGRTPLTLSETGSSVSRIDEDMLRVRQSMPIAEMLRMVPGLAVNRAGAVGSTTQVRMRGGEGNHVLVFIDGVEANDPAQTSEFNFAHLLNVDIESIEVLRGPQSALWGSDALSGVINIQTRRATRGTDATLFVEGGSRGWRNFGAAGGWANEQFGVRLSANTLDTRGSNISRSGGEQDGYQNRSIGLNADMMPSDSFRTELSVRYLDVTNDYDGTDFVVSGLPTDAANVTDTEQWYARFGAELDLFNERWMQEVSATLTDTNNRNRAEDVFAADGFDRSSTAAEKLVFAYQSKFRLPPTRSWLQQLIVAAEAQREDFHQRGTVQLFGDPNRDESMNTDSLTAEYRASLADSIFLQASTRFDNNSEFKDSTTERFSLVWHLADGQTKLRTAYGKGIKNPTFSDRFGFFTNFVGNPDLKPEKSLSWEFGLDRTFLDHRALVNITFFRERLYDEINGFVFDPTLSSFTARNIAQTSRRRGIEFQGYWSVSESLQIGASYSYLHAEEPSSLIPGEDQREIRRPQHLAGANLNWALPDGRTSVNVNVDYNGKMDDRYFPPPLFASKLVSLDDFWLLSVTGSYRLNERLELFGRVENALDQGYEEVFGYRSPGISAYGGFRYRFNR